MERHSDPRWELRMFGDAQGGVSAILETDAALVSEDGGRETYLVARQHPEASVKLRDGRVEVKELVARDEGLELWRPAFSSGFPMRGEVCAQRVLRPLGLEGRHPAEILDAAALFELLRREPDVRLVEVAKRRRRFTRGRVLAEHVRIEVLGRHAESVAAESSDRGLLSRTVDRLGLDPRANMSYPAWLAGVAWA